MNANHATVSKAIKAIQNGQMVILVDDEDRENEGDLVIAAQFATPQAVNFMATHGRGLICLSMDSRQIDALGLPMMASRNESKFGTAFTTSIEAREGVTTGISAFDRSHTIQTAIRDNVRPTDVVSPGHIFPLRAREGGVLVRAGQTEGSVDLARIAGLKPAAVICEIMSEDGTMARRDELEIFAENHGLIITSIKELIAWRLENETVIKEVARANLPVSLTDGKASEFQIIGFQNIHDGTEHVALIKGDLAAAKAPLVRVHSECVTGDAFGSLRCDCGDQLKQSLSQIDAEGTGAVIYMRQHEGRGIGLVNKIRAYALQDKGQDTVEANLNLGFKPDLRHYGIAAQILKQLGVLNARVLTNNPDKIADLKSCGLAASRVPVEVDPQEHNLKYMLTKQKKLGHILNKGMNQ